MLDRFNIRSVRVITTEGRQVIRDWMEAQPTETRKYEWVHVPLESWQGDTSGDFAATLFVLNRQKLDDKHSAQLSSVAPCLQEWLTRDASRREIAGVRQVIPQDNGQTTEICAAVAPSPRLVQVALFDRFKSISEIPQECRLLGLSDIRRQGRVIIVARPANRNDRDKKALVDDLAGKLTTALNSMGFGFQCESRQDLAEVVWNAEMEDNKPSSKQAALTEKIKNTEGLALALADLTAVNCRTDYVVKSVDRITAPYKDFDKPQPKEPTRPTPDDLVYGKSGPKKYPDGLKDARFKNDLLDYQNVQMPLYQEQMRQWAMEKDAYEASRLTHEIEYSVTIDAIEHAGIRGALRIYDLEGYKSLDACRVLFSCDMAGDAGRRRPHKADRVMVVGEANRPNVQVPPPNDEADQSMISDAIGRGCRAAASTLGSNALLPVDRAPAGK